MTRAQRLNTPTPHAASRLHLVRSNHRRQWRPAGDNRVVHGDALQLDTKSLAIKGLSNGGLSAFQGIVPPVHTIEIRRRCSPPTAVVPGRGHLHALLAIPRPSASARLGPHRGRNRAAPRSNGLPKGVWGTSPVLHCSPLHSAILDRYNHLRCQSAAPTTTLCV